MPNVDLLAEFFFEAMRSGWATSSPKKPLPGLLGTKSISFEKGDLKLLDYYYVAPKSDCSYGTTVIWQSEIPRWVMHYGGFYEKRAIPTLKAALQDAYSRNFFYGGRGPDLFIGDSPFRYENKLDNPASGGFEDFCGHERVCDVYEEREVGWHDYFGGLLI